MMDQVLGDLQFHGLMSKEHRYVREDYLSGLYAPRQMESAVSTCVNEVDNFEVRCDPENVVTAAKIERSLVMDQQDSFLATVKQKAKWREKICEWAYQVVDHFGLNREIVYISLHYVDRYCVTMAGTSFDDKRLFQLLSMASLLLAVKLFDSRSLLLRGSESTMDTILQLSRGMFTIKELEQMERDVLQRLQWHVHPPTPQTFLHYLLTDTARACSPKLLPMAIFFVEMSVLDYFFIQFKASEVALAAILNAAEALEPISSEPDKSKLAIPSLRTALTQHDARNIFACQERLKRLHAYSNAHDNANYEAVVPTSEQFRTSSPASVREF